MPIISARDNLDEKRQKTKTQRDNGVTQAIMKVWELHGFAVRLS